MTIFGKIIGGVLGFLVGNIPGLIIGVWIGNSFDKGLNQKFTNFYQHSDPAITQQVFFETTFAIMGHLAKADGVVSQVEIATAERVMTQLGLTDEKRAQAIAEFSRGKSDNFNLDASLQKLVTHCARQPSLIQMFLEIQLLAATADGHVDASEMEILYRIGQAFRISKFKIDQLLKMVLAQQSFHRDGASGNYTSRSGPSIEQAYNVIGVNSSSTKQEIKRAYRKLMSQHHPDKLVSKGMPEEMIKVATEKSQEIQSAYEMIKKQKGF